ncbi:MAG TPA: murein biosynthesis integral membrane protein MurJ [Gaiellaceae bacterium]|nr:murein biosynthesis integral membrane protein MurJ [Gaiellaceae bacterium]
MEVQAPRRRLAWSTAMFSLATGLSRVLGLIREMVAAYFFGASGKINAFTVAFQIPNLLRSLVADQALGSAFVPVFSELLVKGERKRAWHVASSVFFLMALGLGAVTAFGIIFAPLIVKPFGNPGGDVQLAIGLTRVLFPVVFLLGLSGIVVGILNSYDEFTVPAITPVFWNLAIILGLVLGVPNAHTMDAKLYVYAFSILIGTVIQVLIPLPWLFKLDGRLHVAFDYRDPTVRRIFALMIPVTLGLGLINFNAVVDTLFASRLLNPELAPTAIDKAFRVYMLPQGIFSVAIATVLFPTMSRLAARADWEGFRATVGLGLRQMAFLLIPASVTVAVLATPIVRLLYQRGAFTPEQTTVVAGALAAFSLGLTFNGAMLMLNRAFFSLQENWIPTMVALGNLALNALLDWAFYRLGVWGIPLSTSVVNIAGAAFLFWLLRERLDGLPLRPIIASVARILVASAVLGAVAYGVWRGIDSLVGQRFIAQAVALLGGIAAGTVAYAFCARLLGIREIDPLLGLRARFRRS